MKEQETNTKDVMDILKDIESSIAELDVFNQESVTLNKEEVEKLARVSQWLELIKKDMVRDHIRNYEG